MNSILLRIQEIAINEGITVSALERKIGASKGVLSRAINHNTDIQAKWLRSLVENYPMYSERWLLTGKGNKLKKNPDRFTDADSLGDILPQTRPIPVYSLEKPGGLEDIPAGTAVPVDHLVIPNLPPCDGALYVRGDSMDPLLKSGDMVLYQRVTNLEYGILWGEMYIVSYRLDRQRFVAIKYIRKSRSRENIMLVGHNPHFAPSEIPLSCVTALALVKASIRYNTIG